MKKVVFCLLLLTFLFSCKKEVEVKLLTNRIEYDVVVNNNQSMSSWINNVNYNERISLMRFLFFQLESGNAVDSLGQTVNEESVRNLVFQMDSTMNFSQAKLINLVENELLRADVIRFREKWTYNPENMQIFKQVLAIAPVVVDYDTSEFRNIIKAVPLFWVNADTNVTENFQLVQRFIISDAVVQNNIQPITNLYGQCPQYFSSFDQSARDAYFNSLREKITSRAVPAYDYFFDDMASEEIDLLKDHVDTVWTPDENNELQPFPVEKVILPQQFARLKFIEKWEFTTEPFSFRKTVFGVNPSIMVVDEYDVFQGFRPLFWTVFEKDSLQAIRNLK